MRNSSNQNPAHDKNGNMTSLPTRPATGAAAGTNVSTAITFDAFNRPFTAQAGGNGVQDYRYDALGRRIAAMALSGGNITAGRRFVWDGWSVATERLLSGTTGNCDSLLERCYVEGASLDEHLFVAIDGDLDGSLSTNLNVPVSAGATNTNDYLYYYLPNRLGSVMGLLDATDDRYMLEFYRYTVYGEATVLPLYDLGLNQIEDTPTDLSDNNSAMLSQRSLPDATAGRASTFNNQYTFTGRYLDAETGLHYYRFRYYESRTGRFISRDPAETPWENLYSYSNNSSTYFTDPMGLGPCARYLGAAFDSWLQQQKNSTYPIGAEGCRRLQDGYDHALKLANSPYATVAGRDEIGSCLADITQAQLSHGCVGPDKTDAPYEAQVETITTVVEVEENFGERLLGGLAWLIAPDVDRDYYNSLGRMSVQRAIIDAAGADPEPDPSDPAHVQEAGANPLKIIGKLKRLLGKPIAQALKHNKNQRAVVGLAKEAENRGKISRESAEILERWAKEYKIRPARIDGPHSAPIDFPHAHIGPVRHLPVK